MQDKNLQPGMFRSLLLLHRAMLFGQILYAAFVFYMIYSGNFIPAIPGYDQLLQVTAISFTFGGFFAGSFLFKRKIQALKEDLTSLKIKLAAYRSAVLLQWLLIEVPVLFSLSCFLLVGNYAFLALGLLFILLFVVSGPDKTKMRLLLQLSEEEKNQL